MTRVKADTPAELADPSGLGPSGAALYDQINQQFELSTPELLLLINAARCADRLDELAAEARRGDVTMHSTKTGEKFTNPAIVESRMQSIALSRLIASLRLPDETEQTRPQRRGSARGAYGVRGVS